jgi:hypothetical protein
VAREPVDVVAIILAVALAGLVILILTATMVQILRSSFPAVELSDNATQVLTASVGAVTGLLGSYIGGRHRRG